MKTSKLRVTGLCARNSPWPVNSPHKGPVTRIMFPFDDLIVTLAGYNWYTKTKQSKPYPGIHAVLCTMCGMDKVALLLSSRSCQVTLDISGAPLIFNGAPGNIQVNLERYVVTRYWCQTILQPCMWVPCLVFITIKKFANSGSGKFWYLNLYLTHMSRHLDGSFWHIHSHDWGAISKFVS